MEKKESNLLRRLEERKRRMRFPHERLNDGEESFFHEKFLKVFRDRFPHEVALRETKRSGDLFLKDR